MAGLASEIWINHIQENLYPESSFLNYMKDFSELVNYDTINMQEVGADPEVLINNTTYPIAKVKRSDNHLSFALDKFETVNTLIRRPEEIEYSYNQMDTVLSGHMNTLRAKTAEKAAHAIAPQTDSAYTPVIETTGSDNGEGKKKLQVNDILRIKRRFDLLNIPMDERVFLLHPAHIEDLILYDLEAFKEITDFKNGKPMTFAGFKMLQTILTPRYNKTTLAKVAFTAAPSATDTFCSIAYHQKEVFKADGGLYMYNRIDDPEERGTIIGFDKRFICMPIRNKNIGSIVSVDVV